MNFSLIICTYKRSKALNNLLSSVMRQTIYPNEIIIVDGSPDENTKLMLEEFTCDNLFYYQVAVEERGLTKQRNFGISRMNDAAEIVCFLDDDTILKAHYFEELLKTYLIHTDAVGVGGYIINEEMWFKNESNYVLKPDDFVYDGWRRAEAKRFIWRKKFGLDSNVSPGFSPSYSHGRSVGFLPPSGMIYPAEQLMGGVSSFKKDVLEKHKFSNYFEGYGLYEDADFCLRVAKTGNLYINTAAQLEHHHDSAGRPNMFNYGKMVVRNGWYVWRIKNPNPTLADRIKWNSISILLIIIRFTNIFTSNKKREAFNESIGRVYGFLSLLFSKPGDNF